MLFAQSRDGVKLRYEVRGVGAPLALVMGFGGAGRGWGEPFLGLIERKFKTLVIDNRGTGESDKPDRPWTMKDMADDVVSVLDHARIDRAHVFGISMGGMIAQEIGLNHTPRVRGLVLGCTNCGISHSIPVPMEVVANLVPTPGISPEEQMQRALTVAASKAFLESERGKAFVSQMLAEIANYPITPMHTYLRQMAAIQGWDSFARLGELTVPTLVITGDADALIPSKNSEILQRQIPGSRLHIIPGAGHVFPWENPEETADVVAKFLGAVN